MPSNVLSLHLKQTFPPIFWIFTGHRITCRLFSAIFLNLFYFTNFPSKNNFRSDIVLKVRQPSIEEAAKFKEGGTLYSFLYPAQNKELIDEMAKYKLTAFGMDCVPRISRAQVFDALSSMGNISGTQFDVIWRIFFQFLAENVYSFANCFCKVHTEVRFASFLSGGFITVI